MYWVFLTIFSYFAAFLGIFAFGRRKNAVAASIAIVASLVSLGSFFVLLTSTTLQEEFIFVSYNISGLTIDFGFLVDKLSLLMGGIVSFVTTLVFLYSRDYMKDDPEKGRFFALLAFFAGSMLGIVYSVSFIQLFIFWELVGLSSYFLIGFWYKDSTVASSARKVFTTIIIGDAFLLLGLLVLGSAFGTFTFSEIIKEHIHVALPATGVFLVLLGAFAKSAQIPFSMWLPWAMEGPTPVSALLHSATMVKAGVFLIARILPLVIAAHLANFVIVFALLTIFIASLLALAEKDIKRILAYSTISQLGFITFGLGLGAYGASLFHLFNDAFYKALLFLGAGVIIHAGGSRNIFKLKPIHWAKEKIFLILTIIGVLGISGLPPFNGFFSKDLIIDAARETHNKGLYILALIGAFLSALYISRWIFLIMKKVNRHTPSDELSTEKEGLFGWSTKISMGVLALGVILSGWIFTRFFGWLGISDAPRYDPTVSVTSVLLVGTAFLISYLVFVKDIHFGSKRFVFIRSFVYRILDAKFGLVWAYYLLARFLQELGETLSLFDRYIIDAVLHGAVIVGKKLSLLASWIDRRIIDGILHQLARTVIAVCFGSYKFDMAAIDGVVRSFSTLLNFISAQLRKIVSGFATTYVTAIIIAVIFSILFLNGVLAR